jgi:uncharacterized protein
VTPAGLRTTAGGSALDVRVIPRAPKTALDGWRGPRLLVRVTAPPVDRAANDATLALLAEILDVPRSALRVAAGATSRNKTIAVEGLSAAQVAARLP